jgi:hypothetical protein
MGSSRPSPMTQLQFTMQGASVDQNNRWDECHCTARSSLRLFTALHLSALLYFLVSLGIVCCKCQRRSVDPKRPAATRAVAIDGGVEVEGRPAVEMVDAGEVLSTAAANLGVCCPKTYGFESRAISYSESPPGPRPPLAWPLIGEPWVLLAPTLI